MAVVDRVEDNNANIGVHVSVDEVELRFMLVVLMFAVIDCPGLTSHS